MCVKLSQALGTLPWKRLTCSEIITRCGNVYGIVNSPRIVHSLLILLFHQKEEKKRNIYILFRSSGENDSN